MCSNVNDGATYFKLFGLTKNRKFKYLENKRFFLLKIKIFIQYILLALIWGKSSFLVKVIFKDAAD